jgi:hypothetical protein
MRLDHLPSSALTARLYEIRRQERELLVEFLVYLAEVDRRKLYLELGFPSLFAFLTDYLGFTRSSAFRRSTAARMLARRPDVGEHLADGRLCLTTLVELRDVLDEPGILDRAAGRSEEQVKQLVASLRPQPEPLDLLRRLPKPSTPGPELAPPPAAAPPPPAPPPPPARIEPISEERRVLRMTVGREFVADLEAARAALSHVVPDGKLETIIHECIRRTVAALTRKQRGAGKPGKGRKPSGRYLPAPVRREVWERDGGRCAFVGSDGHRCHSDYQVQFHHREAYAKGGPPTVANVSLACARHNLYLAELEFGPVLPARHRRPPRRAGQAAAPKAAPA